MYLLASQQVLFQNEPWIKFPHPLTYTALLKSPFDLTPIENPKEGEEYLLFYVNLMTLDYVEAIIPGDFVKKLPRIWIVLTQF